MHAVEPGLLGEHLGGYEIRGEFEMGSRDVGWELRHFHELGKQSRVLSASASAGDLVAKLCLALL